jgi:phage-related protein
MAMTLPPGLKPVYWIGNTKEDLSALAEDVRDEVGQALFEAQKGGRHSSVKPLSGYGDASVLEVVADYAGDTFRTVYTVRWPTGVYVLHVFQKKSKSGIKTPKADMNLIDARLKRLREMHAEAARQRKGAKDD